MQASTVTGKIRLLGIVGGRGLAFIVLVGLSVPLSAELATLLPSMLPALGLPDGQFGQLVDDYVFDLPVNWSLLTLAPMLLVDTGISSATFTAAVFWSCVGWAPIGLAYAWITRSRELFFFVVTIYPLVWVVGVAMRLFAGAIADA